MEEFTKRRVWARARRGAGRHLGKGNGPPRKEGGKPLKRGEARKREEGRQINVIITENIVPLPLSFGGETSSVVRLRLGITVSMTMGAAH